MNDFKDKIVLITGGTRGVGAQTAAQFANCGARVFISGRSIDRGQQVVADINAAGGEATFIQHDVSCQKSWQSVVSQIVRSAGGLHICINNAGVHQAKSLLNSSEDDFDYQISTNLKGVFLGCKAVVPLIEQTLAAGEYGAIVNVCSIAGLTGTPNQVVYSMTKGGLQLFSQSLALELAAAGNRIRVNCVNPGMIENDMGDELVQQLVDNGVFPNTKTATNYLHRQIPLKRFATTSEVAKSIRFLASDDASYITGIGMPLDGGLTAG
jgi:NAD(P)-dependent dehydrogenase (short-subunit alcohol dehydrogenase family)